MDYRNFKKSTRFNERKKSIFYGIRVLRKSLKTNDRKKAKHVLRWMRKHEKRVYNRIYRFLSMFRRTSGRKMNFGSFEISLIKNILKPKCTKVGGSCEAPKINRERHMYANPKQLRPKTVSSLKGLVGLNITSKDIEEEFEDMKEEIIEEVPIKYEIVDFHELRSPEKTLWQRFVDIWCTRIFCPASTKKRQQLERDIRQYNENVQKYRTAAEEFKKKLVSSKKTVIHKKRKIPRSEFQKLVAIPELHEVVNSGDPEIDFTPIVKQIAVIRKYQEDGNSLSETFDVSKETVEKVLETIERMKD